MCLGVCAELNFAVFLEINDSARHECLWRNCAGHAAIYGERVETENGVFHHAGDNYVWVFCRVTSSMYCGTVPSPP